MVCLGFGGVGRGFGKGRIGVERFMEYLDFPPFLVDCRDFVPHRNGAASVSVQAQLEGICRCYDTGGLTS